MMPGRSCFPGTCIHRIVVLSSMVVFLCWTNSTLSQGMSNHSMKFLRSTPCEISVGENRSDFSERSFGSHSHTNANDEPRSIDVRQENTSYDTKLQQDTQKATSLQKPSKFKPIYNITDEPDGFFGGIQPRAFLALQKPIPCLPNEPEWHVWRPEGQPVIPQGFFFHKPYKTGSSTAAGIHLRMAFNEAARRGYNFSHCRSRFDHEYAPRMFSGRDRSQSFLWTVFRDPTSRIISEFFHMQVSRAKREPSDDAFQAFIRTDGWHQRPYSDMSAPSGKMTTLEQTGNTLLKDYDFIAITERWEESMAVLSLILDIPVHDVVHVSAKGSGGYDDAGGRSTKICTYIVPSFVSEGMRDYFASQEWQEMVYPELQIYRAANASLDRTMDALGRDRVEQRLQEYRSIQEKVKAICEPKTIFPCDSGGRLQNTTDCIWNDSGCGHDCMNRVAGL